MSFLSTIFLVLLPPFFFGLTNLIDNKLTRFEGLKKTSTLVFLCNFTNILFAPVLFLIHPLVLPPVELLPALILIGAIEVVYLFPYFKAYKHLDTSIVSALFALGRIFTPLFAFLMINEMFNINQYFGFLMVVIASVFLSLEKGAKFKLNIGFWLMLMASLFIIFEDVVVKHATFGMNWVNLFFWSGLFATIVSFLILVSGENRKDLRKSLRWDSLKEYAPWFLTTELFQVLGRTSFIFAASLLPITFVEMGMSFQPFLVLITSWILFKLFKFNIWEQKTSYMRKIICFAFMVAGAVLLI